MQNPTKRQQQPQHYTGDFFVETVSRLNSKERGSFVTQSGSENGENHGSGSSSSESLGNKLPISWFTTSQHTGNWQMKNNNDNNNGGGGGNSHHTDINSDALTKKNYNSNSMSAEIDTNDRKDADSMESVEEEENIENKPLNGFFKATKNNFKLKKREQHAAKNGYNKWHNEDSLLSSSSSSSSSSPSSSSASRYKKSSSATEYFTKIPSSSAAASKKRRKSSETELENICSSDNKWQGTTKSNTNAAGGISTESMGLWLVNELCEQDDIIEFR